MNIKSQALAKAPGLSKQFRNYFGVDLSRIPQMSDQELGQLADQVNDMKRLMEILPIIEEHLQALITGQVHYEEFVTRTLKAAEKAGKKIDKLVLDAWLADRGYAKHQALMRQEAGQEAGLQDAEYASMADLSKLDFQTALRLVKMKHDRQTRQIQQKIPDAIRSMDESERVRKEAQQRKELITKGTKFGRVASFFGMGR